MPSAKESLYVSNTSYDWTQKENKWSSAWGGAAAQWFGTLLPRIHEYIPVGTILEIAPGYGTWTEYLKDYCLNLMVIDRDQQSIDTCKERFSASTHITCHVNDGRSLAIVPDGSVDFVFSFDSLIHAEAEVLEAYLQQLAGKLKPGGLGFIHHSNLGMYSELVALTKEVPPEARKLLREKGELIDFETGLHAETMSARLFEESCEKAGLQCVSQELINWFNEHLIGCFSVFTPKDSVWARKNNVVENPHFMDEVKRIQVVSALYTLSTDYEGFHGDMEGDKVVGWAWDKKKPNARVAVDIFDGDTLLASMAGEDYRADIVPYTKDHGCHAFVYELPASVKDGQPHTIKVKIRGTNIDVHGTPKIFTSS
jgi:2-polyprenyl-3-methyl-5-hydroxy-6-metoxy-1,4-benzoquinol methylase